MRNDLVKGRERRGSFFLHFGAARLQQRHDRTDAAFCHNRCLVLLTVAANRCQCASCSGLRVGGAVSKQSHQRPDGTRLKQRFAVLTMILLRNALECIRCLLLYFAAAICRLLHQLSDELLQAPRLADIFCSDLACAVRHGGYRGGTCTVAAALLQAQAPRKVHVRKRLKIERSHGRRFIKFSQTFSRVPGAYSRTVVCDPQSLTRE